MNGIRIALRRHENHSRSKERSNSAPLRSRSNNAPLRSRSNSAPLRSRSNSSRIETHSSLCIGVAAVADPTAFFDALRIVVRPMHQPAEFIPLVHAAKPDSVSHSKRNTTRQIYIVGDQQRLAIAQTQYEALVSRTIVVIR